MGKTSAKRFLVTDILLWKMPEELAAEVLANVKFRCDFPHNRLEFDSRWHSLVCKINAVVKVTGFAPQNILRRSHAPSFLYNALMATFFDKHSLWGEPSTRKRRMDLYFQSIDAGGNILFQGNLGILDLNDISGKLLPDFYPFPRRHAKGNQLAD
jgi:hypothetical protein